MYIYYTLILRRDTLKLGATTKSHINNSIVIYADYIWTLTKRLEKKLDSNYTIMLRAILNKSWRQHLTRHQLYGHLPPIPKTIQVRRTRHAGHCWRSRDELISDVLPGDRGSIPGRVVSKTQKMLLDAALPCSQHYKFMIKGKVEQSRERSSALLYTSV